MLLSFTAMTAHADLWRQRRSFSHRQFPLEWFRERLETTVSVCLPARDEARTIGPILEVLQGLAADGVLHQIVVVDDSSDATPEIARSLGVEVHRQEELAREHGPVLGKGDAMWRALPHLTGELVMFLDADTEDFGAHFPLGLLGPLVADRAISFVKGHYRRPFRLGSITLPAGGGRVTELTARPLLDLFYPELGAIRQPLAGEIAARRDLLERLPFVTGYGVDVALLIDAYRTAGLDSLAQVDLDVRQNAHQPLHDLSPMASAVLGAVAARLVAEGRLREPFAGASAGTGDAPGAGSPGLGGAAAGLAPVERPPWNRVRVAA